jgi:hypothetical protein
MKAKVTDAKVTDAKVTDAKVTDAQLHADAATILLPRSPKGITSVELDAHWREKAPEWHPDRGGDAELFTSRLEAYRRVRKWLRENEARCQTCDGVGRITLLKGFRSLTFRCPACRGSGASKQEGT